MTTTLLVTGARGLLGSAVTAAGWDGVRIVTTNRRGDADDPGVDLTDGAAVAALVGRVSPDVVLHLAAVGVTGARDSLRTVVDQNVGMVTALLDTEVPLVVAGSDVATERADAYGLAKHLVEVLVGTAATWGAPVTVVRLPVLVAPSPDAGLLGAARRAAAAGEPMEVLEPDRVRRWLALPDAVEVLRSVVAAAAAGRGAGGLVVAPGWVATVGAVVEALRAAVTGAAVSLDASLDAGGPWAGAPAEPTHDLAATLRLAGRSRT